MDSRLYVVAAALAAGCFSPSYDDCQLTCDLAEACPSGLACVAGFCRTAEVPEGTCEGVFDPADARPPVADAAVSAVDARPLAVDARVPVAIDATAGPPPPPAMPDASPPPPPPPPPTSDGLCDEDQPPVTPPCGGPVICAKSIKATTVKARVIYAKDVKVYSLDADCVYQANGENHWNQGNGGASIDQPTVNADVIYVKDLDATSIEVIELRAKSVKDH